MKYRIKIITYKSGRQEFYPQVKKGLFWKGILSNGSTSLANDNYFHFRENALKAIDNHYNGNNKKQTIEFEYINKN